MKILFTGDTFLMNKEGEFRFDSSILDLFKSHDNVCINLETTVGEGGTKVPKAYNFQTSPAALGYAKSAGVTVASVANNHSMDYGSEGFRNTLNNLHENDITVIGATDENCYRLLYNEVRCCVSSYFGTGWGISPLQLDKIKADISVNKQDNDIQIVCLHWGEEYVPIPSPRQQSFAHQLIDSGASVVIGHHPHVMQGYEEYHNGLIFYSLGNFNFFVDHPWAKRLIETTKSYCVSLEIKDKGKPKFDIIPITIDENWKPSVITGPDERKRFFNYFDAISKPLSLSIGFLRYYALAAPHYFHNHFPSWKKRIKQYGMPHLIQCMKWLVSPITCVNYAGLVASLFCKRPKY